jgi:hypothetical protein
MFSHSVARQHIHTHANTHTPQHTQGLILLNVLLLTAIGVVTGLKWRITKGFFT